jgi:protocatechuate 3,4-dioxygenase beta subunit
MDRREIKRFWRILAVAGVVAGFNPSVVAGQTITGEVVDRETGQGIGMGFAVLLDGGDREIARVLTSAEGAFQFRGVQPGVYRLKSERIAYRAVFSPRFEMRRGESQTFRLEIEALPLRLESIEVREETSCRMNPAEGQATAILWEEIRKALAAASWTATQRGYRYRNVMYERDLGRGGERVTNEQRRESTGYYQAPFQSREADSLAAEGYAVAQGGDLWFYAPDDKVLRADAFLRTHCFRVVRDRKERPGMIGLAFEPTRGRFVTEINGVLWLDERSSELKTMEFGYTTLPNDVEDDQLGGTVDFIQLPNGAWVVYRWVIRMPLLGIEVIPQGAAGRVERIAVRGYRDAGGEVLSVETTSGETVYSADVTRLSGVVIDYHGGARLGGAKVSVAGTDYVTTADPSGRFILTGYLEGEYGITFSHPRFDSLGYTPPPVFVSLRRGENQFVELEVAEPRVILQSICHEIGPDDDDLRAIVGGVVSGTSGNTVPDATVTVVWQEGLEGLDARQLLAQGSRVRNLGGGGVSDSTGQFRLCGVPTDRTMILRAEKDGLESQPVTVSFGPDGVWYNRDVCLGWSAADERRGRGAVNPSQRSNCFQRRELWPTVDLVWRQDLVLEDPEHLQGATVVGVVTDLDGGAPLADAEVVVDGTDLVAKTDANGSFRFEELRPGSVTITIRRDGYAATNYEFEVRSGETLQLPRVLITLHRER